MSATEEWTFVVYVDAQRGAIVHKTSPDARVYDITERVQHEQKTKRAFSLFKPDGLFVETDESLPERVETWITQNPSARPLGEPRLLSKYFPRGPSPVSAQGSEVHLVAIPNSEKKRPLNVAISEQPRNLVPLGKRIVKRTRIMTAVLDKLLDKRLIQIMGGPSSGKSTMLDLLANAILTHFPDARLFRIAEWDRKGKNCEERFLNSVRNIDTGLPISMFNFRRLSEDKWPPLFLLHDMAQNSFADIDLWLLYKTTTYSNLYIAFASVYDFPFNFPYGIQGPAISLGQKVLHLSIVDEEIAQLFFTPAEYQEYREARLQEDSRFEVDDDLASLMYRWSSGHPGALDSFFEAVKMLAPEGGVCSLQEFDKNLAAMLLGNNRSYCGNAINAFFRDTDFFRGFTADEVAPESETIDLIRLLLLKTELFIDLTTEPRPSGLEDATKRGWVTTYIEGFYIWVFFASPLHRYWFAERFGKLESDVSADTLLDFICDVVSRFRPTRLRKIPERVRTLSASIPEIQYKNEFYWSCSNPVTGATSVFFSPESGTDFSTRPVGRVDGYVISKRWGTEMTYDGLKLDQYDARFSSSSVYETFMSDSLMADYILVNFCNQLPVEKHVNLTKLYHVVFTNECNMVQIYNCELQQVGEPVMLEG
ncbi:hypothetical protein VKT23_010430 [Stygiomarasmius scandens]|uniref:AAA+ ATPase domain-containing protein n=1 Tax=Marasmiellus scandens TaxID=2682957 RepID=A0ABR1JGD1_9AGAR